MRAGIRNGHNIRDDLRLAQSFIVSKEKRFVLLDGTAEAAAELILTVRRWLRARVPRLDNSVEEVASLELVVAQKLVRGAVERVRARTAGSVDYRAAAAELCGVRVGQRLKLRDRLHSERRSQPARARTIVPEIHHVLIVQEISLSGRTRSGDRVLLTISIKRAPGARSAQRDLCHAGSQRQKLREVSPVEREIGNLLRFHQRSESRRLRFHCRNLGCDRDGLLRLAHRQSEIDNRIAPHRERDVLMNDGLETRSRGLHLVPPDG